MLVLVLYKFATKVDKPHRDSLMTVTIGAGLAIATVQTLSAFSKVEVQWVEPLKTLRGFLSFLTFDIGILRPGCWFGNVDPLQNYIGSLILYPMGAAAVMLVFAVAKYVLQKEITVNQVINAQGLIVSAVYIAAWLSWTVSSFFIAAGTFRSTGLWCLGTYFLGSKALPVRGKSRWDLFPGIFPRCDLLVG